MPPVHFMSPPLYTDKLQLLLVPRKVPPSSSVVFTLTRIEHEAPEHVTETLMFADPAAIVSSLALADCQLTCKNEAFD